MWYVRTNKIDATHQIAIREQRVRVLRQIEEDHAKYRQRTEPSSIDLPIKNDQNNIMSGHYAISKRKFEAHDLRIWLDENDSELAFEVRMCITC